LVFDKDEMEFIKQEIQDVILCRPAIHYDERGFFLESYKKTTFFDAGISKEFVQDNHSRSKQGVLRGLHYQVQKPQAKLVQIIAGQVFDVAVDIRKNSPTYGKWTGIYLSSENKELLWIPGGFAHGLYILSSWAEVLYKTTDFYSPEHERTIQWNDSALRINWPLVNNKNPILSPKDSNGTSFTDIDLH
jgi:dTDP-4-dehydrorhamnose 3,5-epimerase